MTATPFAEPWLRAQARRRPRALALIDDAGVTFTFADMARDAECGARHLLRLGLRRGDRLALLLQPAKPLIDLLHAAQYLGVVSVPLNHRLHPVELVGQLRNAAPAVLVADAAHAGLATEVGRQMGNLRTVDVAEITGHDAVSSRSLPERIDLAALHSIIYTSGTTSAPKGVMLTNANHLASATASARRLKHRVTDRWLNPLPLHHVGGLSILLRSAILGFAVVQCARFDPVEVTRAIHTRQVTLVSLVATMLRRMLDAAAGTPFPAHLRCALLGGAPTPDALLQRAHAAAIPAVPTYGMTEAASQICTATADDLRDAPGAVGRPLDGVVVTIDAEDAEGWGTIRVRGPQVTPGYFRDPERTAAAIVNGALHTGDRGRLDSRGRLWVAGRQRDLIITGGENVMPDEVEAVLTTHPSVRDAAVFPVPDDLWGQRVAAAVVLEPGAVLDPEDLTAWCRQHLAGFKIPRHFEAVPLLPRTPSGKLLRHHVRSGAS